MSNALSLQTARGHSGCGGGGGGGVVSADTLSLGI